MRQQLLSLSISLSLSLSLSLPRSGQRSSFWLNAHTTPYYKEMPMADNHGVFRPVFFFFFFFYIPMYNRNLFVHQKKNTHTHKGHFLTRVKKGRGPCVCTCWPPGLKNEASAEVPNTAVPQWPLQAGIKSKPIPIRAYVKMPNFTAEINKLTACHETVLVLFFPSLFLTRLHSACHTPSLCPFLDQQGVKQTTK